MNILRFRCREQVIYCLDQKNTCNSNSSSFNLEVRNTSTFIDELVTSEPRTVLPGLCFRKTSHFHVPDFSKPMLRILIPHSPFSRGGN